MSKKLLSRDDLELDKFIKFLSLVKVDVHNYPRTVFTYDGSGNVLTRTDYAKDKTTAVRLIEYTYDGAGNVTEVETTELA